MSENKKAAFYHAVRFMELASELLECADNEFEDAGMYRIYTKQARIEIEESIAEAYCDAPEGLIDDEAQEDDE